MQSFWEGKFSPSFIVINFGVIILNDAVVYGICEGKFLEGFMVWGKFEVFRIDFPLLFR